MPSEDTQFKEGNPGGPGRPKGVSVKNLIKNLLDEGEGKRAQAVADALIRKAEDGDVPAAKLVIEINDGPLPTQLNINDARTPADEYTVEQLEAMRAAAEAHAPDSQGD